MEIKDFKKQLFERAQAYGFTEYELYYNSGESFVAKIYNAEVNEYKNTSYRGAGFRGIYKGKMGYAYSQKIDADIIEILLENAAENAFIIENSDEKLYKGDENYPDVPGVSQKLMDVSIADKINYALLMEKTAYEVDSRVSSVDQSTVATEIGDIYMANSYGMELYQRNGYVTAFIVVNVKDGDDVKVNYEIWQGIDFDGFEPVKTGKKAVEKAVKSLGAKPVSSKKYSIILENNVAIDLINVFISSFYAENVQKGFSLLAGKIGNKIASEIVTIKDAAKHEKSLTPLSFDSEGVTVQDKAVVTTGVLNTYLYNYKAALKENIAPTGNGFKGSYKGTVGTACANLYIEPGSKNVTELTKEMSNGLFITALSGLHSGCNSISGDFSLLAEGFLIENGEEVQPVEQITVAGNFYELLLNIKNLANDLKFEPQGAGGSLGSPSLLIEDISVAGL